MDKANWDAYHTRVFCEICKEETLKNNRPLGCLNAKGYKNLEDKFFQTTKARLTKKQFKNKWDMLKKEYTQFMELKHAATGLGWDEESRTIEADDNWWEIHLKMDATYDGSDDEANESMEELLEMAHLAFEVAMVGELGNMYSRTYLNKSPYRIPQQTGFEWVMENLDRAKSSYKMFRMYPEVFMSLHDLLVSDYGLASSRGMTSLESLGMFLWMVGAPQSFSQVENRFARSLETIHRKFKEVLNCLCKLASNNVRPIDHSFTTPHARVKDERFWPHFKGAIGAIDGSHIPCVVPASEVVKHTGRHGYTSQNVMAICDFDLRFTFIVVGWPGSVHDTRILNHSLVEHRHKFPFPPKGKYYLVDSGYPNRKGYLAPFPGQTYHLPEFRRRGKPMGKEETFNYAHSSMRNSAERSLGVLKEKFRMLKKIPSFKPRRQKKIIVACVSLHNYIRDTKLRDKEFDRCDADENYMPKVVRRAAPIPHDRAPPLEDTVNMKVVRNTIADSLFRARQDDE